MSLSVVALPIAQALFAASTGIASQPKAITHPTAISQPKTTDDGTISKVSHRGMFRRLFIKNRSRQRDMQIELQRDQQRDLQRAHEFQMCRMSLLARDLRHRRFLSALLAAVFYGGYVLMMTSPTFGFWSRLLVSSIASYALHVAFASQFQD